MPTVRPLPDRPNLEYVRKEAKALLRKLKAGERAAFERASVEPKLADAQLMIAREYGFPSWPRLVRYFDDVERQQHAHMQLHGGNDTVEAEARALLSGHERKSAWALRAVAAYVPRFFGVHSDAVPASGLTEEEARLAVARMHGAPSWTVLLERIAEDDRARPGDWEADPMRAAGEAIRNVDISGLERVTREHPELLRPSPHDVSTGRTLMWLALGAERRQGVEALRPVIDWLTARGFDRQRELNIRLCGHMRMTVEEVRSLLDQGANPDWIAPSGIPVLEHALLRYWNRDAVDLLAARTTPRKALWIAAGLGDVDGVRAFLDRDGNPTVPARRMRPDFIAVGARGFMPVLPEASNEELLLEALLVAVLNGRTNVVEYMASRGAPINSMIYGSSLAHIAVGNGMADIVECLVRCGADLDLHGASPDMTTRDLARYMFEQSPDRAERRRIAVLCGIDPEAVLAAPASPPAIDASLQRALALANEDANRQNQKAIGPENLLIGLLRTGGPPYHFLREGMDGVRFRADLADRLAPQNDVTTQSDLPMAAAGTAAVEAAIAFAARKRRSEVYSLHLLHALMQDENVAELLKRYDVDTVRVTARLELGL